MTIAAEFGYTRGIETGDRRDRQRPVYRNSAHAGTLECRGADLDYCREREVTRVCH